jgi:hypothetical protein
MGNAIGWGAGSGMSYPDLNFAGATKFDFWFLSTGNMHFQLYWTEGNLTADGDDWMYNMVAVGNSTWVHYSIPLSSMTTSTPGHTPDPQDVAAFWWDDNGPYTPYSAHSMYFDDLKMLP